MRKSVARGVFVSGALLTVICPLIVTTGCPAERPVVRRASPRRMTPPRLPDDPDDPRIWVRKLQRAKTAGDAEVALINLYRIYEVRKALAERDPSYVEKTRAFRRLVNPVLVKFFRKKVGRRHLIPDQILEKLVIFEADGHEAGELLMSVVRSYANSESDEYGDEDTQETLAAKAVQGLAKMASRGKLPTKGLAALDRLVSQICRKPSSAGVRGLDPRSFVRNAVVKAVPDLLTGGVSRARLGKLLARLVLFGQLPKAGQDPMVTIFGIVHLGRVGDPGDDVVRALTIALLGKGRGRRFYAFAATALAQLPLDRTGRHPAVAPLLLMVQGDPWKRRLAALKRKATPAAKRQARDLSRWLQAKKVMPRCPFPRRHDYVCALFWRAHVEEWDKVEPGVIPLNAMLVLRELGDTSDRVIDTLIGAYGVDAVQKRWLAQARSIPDMERTRDKTIPGVQMQKMMIGSYGADMNLRMVMLRALGRMGAMTKPKVAKELLRSLTWAGDPSMMVKAGEGLALARFDKKRLEQLIRASTRAASAMMVSFKKRQVMHYFWGKAAKGTCPAGQELEDKFKACLRNTTAKNANWRCFQKLKRFWVPELHYAVGFHGPKDLKRYVQPFCRKTDAWWNGARVKLEARARGRGVAVRRARLKLYACSKKPLPKELKKKETVRCGRWNVCDERNNWLCLDGHWQLRQHFHRHAALLATPEYVDQLLAFTARDLMAPHRIRARSLPRKGRSAFYDEDDAFYLKRRVWSRRLERARLKRAREVLEQRLCEHRQLLWVVRECGSNLAKYINVVRGVQKVPTEDCRKLQPQARRRRATRPLPSTRRLPGWRARLKALRMLAIYGRLQPRGSRLVKSALRAAIELYAWAERLPRRAMHEIRAMVLLVLDRLADYRTHRRVMCSYPYTLRARTYLREKYFLDQLQSRLARAQKDKRPGKIRKLKARITRQEARVSRELKKIARDQPCFQLLKLVIEDETQRRVRGVWQINRDARNALGRLARRARLRYDQI